MKNAIVFGATSGIGKSVTRILIKEGYKVAITGRRLERNFQIKFW
jgi:NADP-dependent 3-hydroxy acid dehydrogenase YdfG